VTAAVDARTEFLRLADEIVARATELRDRWVAEDLPPARLAPLDTAIRQARGWSARAERGEWPPPGVRLGVMRSLSDQDLGPDGRPLLEAIHAFEVHWIREGDALAGTEGR
jgi:hypothetical protein